MRVTIKEIARELGLSHSTVSRVLNERQNAMVSDATRDRIVATAHNMGYRPNRIAQALKGDHSGLIGVFMPEGQEYFFNEVLFHLRRLIERDGHELIPFTCSDLQVESSWLKLLRWDLEGILVFDYLLFVDGLGQALMHHRGFVPPVVGLFNSRSQLEDFVAIDFNTAMNSLLNHLVDGGFQRIAYAAAPGSFQPAEQRFAIYSEFVQRLAMKPIHIHIKGGTTLCESARLSALNLVSNMPELPDAIFCQNDEIALGVYRAFRERDVAVPGEVAIAGCDNIPFMAYLDQPLTTLTLPVQEACKIAWETLQHRISSPDKPHVKRLLEASLTIRSSSRRIVSD